jgi:hypothetical protein
MGHALRGNDFLYCTYVPVVVHYCVDATVRTYLLSRVLVRADASWYDPGAPSMVISAVLISTAKYIQVERRRKIMNNARVEKLQTTNILPPVWLKKAFWTKFESHIGNINHE